MKQIASIQIFSQLVMRASPVGTVASQENMKTMRGMGGQMMMGSGQRGGIAMDGHKDMAGGGMMQHHELMEKRMDMMQMMMEQMMQHDQMTESMHAK